ncbi:hypothetical protein [Immundisolibacter sp.]
MAYDPATATLRVLARMDSPAGLLRRPDGGVVVSQDRPDGKLWLLRDDAAPQLLADGLDQPEGVCMLPDGRIGIAESGRGRILAWGVGRHPDPGREPRRHRPTRLRRRRQPVGGHQPEPQWQADPHGERPSARHRPPPAPAAGHRARSRRHRVSGRDAR